MWATRACTCACACSCNAYILCMRVLACRWSMYVCMFAVHMCMICRHGSGSAFIHACVYLFAVCLRVHDAFVYELSSWSVYVCMFAVMRARVHDVCICALCARACLCLCWCVSGVRNACKNVCHVVHVGVVGVFACMRMCVWAGRACVLISVGNVFMHVTYAYVWCMRACM